jgi:cysteinyl-tRNA synthetase
MIDVLADDLNTAGAIAALHKLANAGNAPVLLASARLLGLLEDGAGGWAVPITGSASISIGGPTVQGSGTDGPPPFQPLIDAFLEQRAEARRTRDFDKADEIRAGLAAIGLLITDSPKGQEYSFAPGFDPEKLRALK